MRVLQRAGADIAKYCQIPAENVVGNSLVRSTSVPENFTTLSPNL